MVEKMSAIQGLRFLGFLLIFLIHSSWLVSPDRLFNYGGRGVEIFFVLSGYLMAYNFAGTAIPYDFKSCICYMFRKLKKFYVLHLITLFVILLFFIHTFYKHGFQYHGGMHQFILDFFLNIMLLQSWYDPSKFSFNGVSWFLSSILFMYLCTPLLIHKVNKIKSGGVVFLFILLISSKMILDTLAFRFGINPLPGVFSFYANPIYRFMDYLVGFLGAVIISKGFPTLSSMKVSALQIAVFVIYLICCMKFDKAWMQAQFLLITLLLVYVFSLRNGVFDKIFGNPFMVHLGNISFELFMVHQVIIRLFASRIKNEFSLNGTITVLLMMFLSILVAEFFHWKPVRECITQRFWNKLSVGLTHKHNN